MTKGWYQIVMAVAIAMILALLGAAGNWIHTVYAEHKEVVATVHSHMVDEAQQQTQQAKTQVMIEQIAKDVGDVKKMTLTVIGFAKVQADGGDEASALINNNGRAMMYQEGQRVRVTNMVSEEQQSVIVKVNGSFSMPDENKLILLSKKAGAMLGLAPEQSIRVKLEPVMEKK
jgi:hypothetical protein